MTEWKKLEQGGEALFDHGVPLVVRDCEGSGVCRESARADLLKHGWLVQLDEWELGKNDTLECRVRWAEQVGA